MALSAFFLMFFLLSRNMIYSGLVILAFIVLHFIDFWFPEINTKYIVGDMSGLLALFHHLTQNH